MSDPPLEARPFDVVGLGTNALDRPGSLGGRSLAGGEADTSLFSANTHHARSTP